MSVVVELSMVVPLFLLRRKPIVSGWPRVLLPMSFAFQLASFNILHLLSQIDHPFSRLECGLILKQKVQIGKIWFMQVQKMYRTKFIILIKGKVSLVFLFGDAWISSEREKYLDLEFIFLVVCVYLFASLNLCIVATVLLVQKGCLQLAQLKSVLGAIK